MVVCTRFSKTAYINKGVVIGSAVAPLWNLMTWKKASGTGAVIAAWGGLTLALTGWLLAAMFQSKEISVDTLGTNEVMLTGNLIAIMSSAVIHWAYSTFVDPQDFDFEQLNDRIRLVEDDRRGLTAAEQDPELLARTESWITRRCFTLSIVLIVVWPLLTIPAGVFTQTYFAFWVLVSLVWGFSAALVATILPWVESMDDINLVLGGLWNWISNGERKRRESRAAEVLARNAQNRIDVGSDKWSHEEVHTGPIAPESAPEP